MTIALDTVTTIDFDAFTQPGVTCKATCEAEDDGEIKYVAQPVNPNQVRLDIDAIVKKRFESPKQDYANPTRWVGVGRSQKYC